MPMKLSKVSKSRVRIILAILIIALVAWLALRNSNNNWMANNMSNVLDTPAAIYKKHSEVAYQPIAIQCNSWKLLNQQVYILDQKGNRLEPVVKNNNGNDNSTVDRQLFKLELGLAGPRTVSIFNPASATYVSHNCTTGSVEMRPVDYLADRKARMSASWIPYVSLARDGSRTYMFAPAANYNGYPVSNKWLQDNLETLSIKHGKFMLREAIASPHTNRRIDAPVIRKVVARTGDTSNQDYPTRVVCNALEDTDQYSNRQRNYMKEYYGYYDRANAETSASADPNNLEINDRPSADGIMEGFSDGMRKGDRRKRTVRALKSNGMLDNLVVKSQELFTDAQTPTSVSDSPANMGQGGDDVDFNAAKANVFKPHTGIQFNDILNHHAASIQHDSTDDRIFDRLERAKMDPSVQNLLDYNAERTKIYQNENADFQQKLNNRIRENRDKTTGLVRNLDQHRIREMSRRLFFLKNATNDS